MISLGLGLGSTRINKFTPGAIGGLRVWLDAADTGTITHTGGLVDQINDKSGGGHHAAAATTLRPTTGTRSVNGKNALDFVNDRLTIPYDASFQHGANGYTAITIAQFDTVNSNAVEVLAARYGSTGGQRSWLMGNLNNTDGIYLNTTADGTAVGVVSTAVKTTASPRLFFSRYNGAGDPTGAEIGIDNAAALANYGTTRNVFNGTENIVIGSLDNNSFYFNGLICEFLYFNRALTDAELDQIGAYAAGKWGVSWT